MPDNPRIEELRRRVQADPASIAFAALAEEYRRARRYKEAIETCRTGLQRHPSYLSARVTLGRSLVEIGEFEEARRELEHVLRAAPENLAAIRALAEIHERRGETPEALEHYRAALEVARQDTPAPASPVSTTTAATASTASVVAELSGPKPVAAPSVPVSAPAQPLPPLPPPEPEADPMRLAEERPRQATLEGLEHFLASIQAARRTLASGQLRSSR